MIRAYHIVFGAYGFWLPNDPRGSWSEFVRSWELVRFGKATKVSARRSHAADPHDHDLRRAAKDELKYPAVRFTGPQALAVAQGFRRGMDESAYVLHACSILPEHVHLVVAPHTRKVEQIIGHMKGRASQQLTKEGIHPMTNHSKPDGTHPSPWADGCWKVYLNDDRQVASAIQYVQDNPIHEGKPKQNWSFVTPYVV